MLVAARDAGVRRFVYAASSSAYGDTEVLPKVETMTPRPQSPYAVSKLVGEQYCAAFHRVYGLPAMALRYFNVFGPRQDPESTYAAVIPRFIREISAGRAPVIFGDGEQSRDFTYVDNVVRANLLACDARAEADGQVFNVGAGGRISLNAMTGRLAELLGAAVKPVYAAGRPGDVRHSQAGIDKARMLLHYQPGTDVDTGLRLTAEWSVAAARTPARLPSCAGGP
jgi:nucleoside-diphosphate-sugar epimerase